VNRLITSIKSYITDLFKGLVEDRSDIAVLVFFAAAIALGLTFMFTRGGPLWDVITGQQTTSEQAFSKMTPAIIEEITPTPYKTVNPYAAGRP